MQRLLKLNPVATIFVACILLSILEFGTIFLATWFGDGRIDTGLLHIVYSMIAPILLFYLLPLQTIHRLNISKLKSIILYVLVIFLLSITMPFFSQFFPDAVSLPRSASAVCLVASEKLEFGLRASCIGHVFLVLLFINTIWWAAPLALFEVVLLMYKRVFGSRSAKFPD
jgi:hypothetical protein